MAKHEIVGRDGRRRWVDDGDDYVLGDGERLVVSLAMRDALSPTKAVADAKAQDGFDPLAQCRHQPGHVLSDAAAFDAKRAAYLEYCDDLQNGWKTPPVGDRRRKRKITTYDPQGREVSWEEHLEEDDAAPPPVPRTMTADEGRAIKDAAWNQMCEEMRNAWKGNRA